jgi:heterodisulfide reductase subunit D
MSTTKFQETIKACSSCLMCRHACTVGNVTMRDTNLPRGKALLLLSLQKGLLDWDERAVEVVYQCTNCHLCREWCPPGWDIAPLMVAARAEVVAAGLTPPAALQIKQHFEGHGNPYGEAHPQLGDWIKDFSNSEPPEVLYYAGSTVSFRLPEIARAAVSIFKHLGVPFTMLEDELDCAEMLYVLGFQREARTLAARNLDAIRSSGASIIISSDPTCIDTFRHGYHEWGIEVPPNLHFLHMSEYLANALASGTLKLSGALDGVVTYHDPCSLGREMKVFDAPRQVLSAVHGLQLNEMRLNREHSPCCGNGGGVPATFPEIASGAGANAGEVILETGADILVTSCPSCQQSLKKHVPGMEVRDLTVIIAQALT